MGREREVREEGGDEGVWWVGKEVRRERQRLEAGRREKGGTWGSWGAERRGQEWVGGGELRLWAGGGG